MNGHTSQPPSTGSNTSPIPRNERQIHPIPRYLRRRVFREASLSARERAFHARERAFREKVKQGIQSWKEKKEREKKERETRQVVTLTSKVAPGELAVSVGASDIGAH